MCALWLRYLSSLRNKPVRLMEIGVFKGGSLMLWWQYFNRPSIFLMVDRSPQFREIGERLKELRATYPERGHNCTILVADQHKRSSLTELRIKAAQILPPNSTFGQGLFEVIIDDGSHLCDCIINSFEHLFDLLVPGGVYIIEDLNVQFDKCIRFIRDLLDIVHIRLLSQDMNGSLQKKYIERHPSVYNTIASVHCMLEMCVITRSGIL